MPSSERLRGFLRDRLNQRVAAAPLDELSQLLAAPGSPGPLPFPRMHNRGDDLAWAPHPHHHDTGETDRG